MATVTEPKKFNHEESQRRVRHPLQLVRNYIRGYIILEGLALTILCAALLFWLGLAFDYGLFLFDFEAIRVFGIDWILELNELDTSGIASVGCRIVVLAVVVVALIALGFSKLVLRWLREFNDRALALVLERRFPKQLGDRLITAIELADPKLSKKYGYSQAMVEKTILEAVDILKKLPVAGVFNWRRLVGLWFAVGISTVGLLFVNMVVVCVGSVVVEVTRSRPSGSIVWGGVNLTTTDANMQKQRGLNEDEGLVMTSVAANSAGEKAGLKVGDVVVKINDASVPNNLDSFKEQVDNLHADQALNFVVVRNGKQETIKGAKLPADAEREAGVQPKSVMISPWGFAWRFYDVAAIWTERNIFMMSTYWPRRAHLEFARFQALKKDPNDMRVPADEEDKGVLQVRAYEWVIADRDAKKAPHGWRSLTWKDLSEHRIVKQALLARVKIPVDFPDWKMDADELEPNLVKAVFGEDTKDRKSGEVRAHLKQASVQRKIAERGADEAVEKWLDWNHWTVDKIKLLKDDTEIRTPLRDVINVDDLDAVFKELEEKSESALMSRTIRQLDIPKKVEVNFVGEETIKEGKYGLEAGNKYIVPLKLLTDSTRFKFRARGDNYFTPKKVITLVAAPTPAAITTDSEEPAYIYHRLPYQILLIDDPKFPGRKKEVIVDDQGRLAGVKHVIKGLTRSIAGDVNAFNVMRDSKLVIHVQIDNTPIIWGGLWLNKLSAAQREQLKLPANEGLLVTNVDPGTTVKKAALVDDPNPDKAGLSGGDVVVSINGVGVANDLEAVAQSIQDRKLSHDVDFVVLRDGNRIAFRTVTMPGDVKYFPRKLRSEFAVIAKESPNPDKGSEAFKGEIKIDKDHFGFSLVMNRIEFNHDFMVDFFDEDNIRGKRRFKIQRALDAEPSVGALNVFGYLPRKPRFKTPAPDDKEKDKDKGKPAPLQAGDQSELANAILITPDANIPFECRVTDDHGLVRVGYYYQYRKVDFELIGLGGAKKTTLPTLEINQEMRRYHAVRIASNLQLWPGNPIAWHAAPNFIAYTSAVIQKDLLTAQGYKEDFVSSPGFADLLDRKLKAGEMKALNNLVLSGPRNPRPWEFDFKDDGGFDLQRHLPDLKTIDPKNFVQMHYLLKIGVQASDNDVEHGKAYTQEFFVSLGERQKVEEMLPQAFIEEVKDGDDRKLKVSVPLRGNVKDNLKGPISFLVVTENELLSQIALEEESLNEKLEIAKDKVDKGMVSLLEQRSKLTDKDGKPDMDGISTRMNLIRTALGSSGNNLREAHGAYENILKELTINRVKSDRVKNIQDRIIVLLDQIVNEDPRVPGSGSYPIAEAAYLKAHQLVEEDANAKRDADLELHQRNFNDAYQKMAALSKDIQHLLDAMQEGIVESRLIAFLASMEQVQRQNSIMLERLRQRLIFEAIENILGKDKDKNPPKKEEPKEEKKSSQLQGGGAQLSLSLQARNESAAPTPLASNTLRRFVAPTDTHPLRATSPSSPADERTLPTLRFPVALNAHRENRVFAIRIGARRTDSEV